MEKSLTQSWLMNYEILRLVNQCRRLVDAEFGEKPMLSDGGIWRRLGELAGQSRSQGTQRVYAELRLALLNLDDTDWPAHVDEQAEDMAQPAVRMYRGRPVAAPEPDPAEAAPASESTAREATKTITYRGRTIQVA